jgi:hypothetical protein
MGQNQSDEWAALYLNGQAPAKSELVLIHDTSRRGSRWSNLQHLAPARYSHRRLAIHTRIASLGRKTVA